ncbi:Protein-tyrosine-phosphatase MKP1 [Capsicum annuum]|uniref:Protein-tyrosine-phosphatase MKP1 n=1 Tax=Capsicum annuum TaxID=4072 RepID=A0A2G2XTM7_CAPAN|nr:Protein-tyrosine-phosphatase MKP1 [Capsicum annuum]
MTHSSIASTNTVVATEWTCGKKNEDQESFKARQRLPLLQPLAIARRSLDEWPRSGSDDIGEWPLPSTPSERDTNSNSERLNLDLSNIHKNPEINAGLVRREKIAFFDKECSKVAEHVFLGGDAVAKDKDILKQNGITHVLNCVGFVCPECFKSDFVYQTLWLHDSPSEDITSILYDVFDYFEDVREQHGSVFVHCYQGVSWSSSLVIGYLMWREGQIAKDKDILKQNGITHVLNCVGFVCPEYFKSDFIYQTLWLHDSPSEDIKSILYDVFDYFEDVREQHGRVFVHCYQGVSGSSSLVIGYLMWREGQSFDVAFEYVKAARCIADPDIGFACQLLQCQKRVHAFPLSPSSLLRMYRVAPHSPYDPLHLIPKMLNDPSPSALDSRGAFIIHIPSSIYVWIGKKSEAIMERDARGAVCQIVRYEKVQAPIITVMEGGCPKKAFECKGSSLEIVFADMEIWYQAKCSCVLDFMSFPNWDYG